MATFNVLILPCSRTTVLAVLYSEFLKCWIKKSTIIANCKRREFTYKSSEEEGD